MKSLKKEVDIKNSSNPEQSMNINQKLCILILNDCFKKENDMYQWIYAFFDELLPVEI